MTVNRGRDRTAELIADMADQIEAGLRIQMPDLDIQQARVVARQVALYMAQHYGGQNVYFPKNHFGRLSARDAEIWAKFDGRNHFELAQEYDLTVQHIYRIIKEALVYHQSENQGDLFGDGEP